MANLSKAVNDFRFIFERFAGMLELLPAIEKLDILENRLLELETSVSEKEKEALEWNKALDFAEDKLDAISARKARQEEEIDEAMAKHIVDMKLVQENMIREAADRIAVIQNEAADNLAKIKEKIAQKSEEFSDYEAKVYDQQMILNDLQTQIQNIRDKLLG